jgi:hypothetical protein
MTAQTAQAATTRRGFPSVRYGLLGGLLLGATLIAYTLDRYPATLRDSEAPLYLGILALLFVGYGAAALLGTRPTTLAAASALRLGARFGLALGGLWLIEVVAGNFGRLLPNRLQAFVLLPYFGAILAVLVVAFAAGFVGAQKSGRAGAGLCVGLWSGLLGGLIPFLALLLVAILFMGVLQQDPQNIHEFQRSSAPDLATAIAGDFMAAATNHLWIGPLLGFTLGGLGALVGAMARQGGLLATSPSE